MALMMTITIDFSYVKAMIVMSRFPSVAISMLLYEDNFAIFFLNRHAFRFKRRPGLFMLCMLAM